MNPEPKPKPPTLQQDLLALVNVPLVVSAAAEGLAGAVLCLGTPVGWKPYLLALASALLFGAGSLFSHNFDRPVDAVHRPERPLPAGRLDAGLVWRLALTMLVAGAALPGLLGRAPALAAVGVALLVALYAALGKSLWGVGFAILGAARGLNLLLGLTADPLAMHHYVAAAVPVALYAAGWAVLRASRQPGAPPSTGLVALLHLAAGTALCLYQSYYRLDPVPFFLVLLGLTFPRFVRAMLDPRRPQVLEAVQYGFIGLTLLEATLVAGQVGVLAAACVALACLPLYAALRKWPILLLTDPR
jgi:4-hydroxybenzoate polyprenyltransferase